MKGLIVVNSYAETKSELNQAIRMKEEFSKLNVQIDIVPTYKLSVIIQNGNFANDLTNIDFVLYFDKDKHVLEMLDKLNIKIFNSAKAIEICDDKLLTHITLANHNVEMPKTIGGVLCYYPNATYNKFILDKVENELGYPIVIKECFGSIGKGVYLATNRIELENLAEKVKLKAHLFQSFITASSGIDIRVIVIGGHCVGGMKRQNSTDFRSNIGLGGSASMINLPEEYIKISEKVANVLGLDYCGIDLLIDKHNKPLICEVNSNAFFEKFENVTGINVAKLYAEYIIKNIK